MFVLDISTEGVHVPSPFVNRLWRIRIIWSVCTNYIRWTIDQNTSTYIIQSNLRVAKLHASSTFCVIVCLCFIILQVIDETLSPTWDELLIINEVILYGTKEDIKNHPPTIVVEIFDQDKVVIVLFHVVNINLLFFVCFIGKIWVHRKNRS